MVSHISGLQLAVRIQRVGREGNWTLGRVEVPQIKPKPRASDNSAD